ncbi:hypothetical protein [Subsaximicrobium wynnwilliamsii]|uniref:hypothetical protein n=1 Tax=Subsaximicrobium wynnwilliamsii TaxID=291179 RepID=UPI0016729E88|nr:hypothetical protein [Subsaximicrobium wynnwilliamsii]
MALLEPEFRIKKSLFILYTVCFETVNLRAGFVYGRAADVGVFHQHLLVHWDCGSCKG